MMAAVHPQAWQQLALRIEATLGLQFADLADLRRGFRRAVAELGGGDDMQCLARVLERWPDPAVLRTLARHLTVGETYFLRDRPMFEALQHKVLPELLHARRAGRHLRIWCAACCTGEEVYTLAIVLHRIIPDLSAWNITLLGTDLNEDFLAKAREASYGAWSFREAADWMYSPAFERDANGRCVVAPHLRRMAIFRVCNLAQEDGRGAPGPASCDLILCRNVLMYFAPAARESVLRRLQDCLAPGGVLVVGAGEIGCVKSPVLQTEYHPGAVLYRKRAPALPPAAPVAPLGASAAPQPQQPAVARVHAQQPPDGVTESLARQARALADQGAWHEALACCDRWLSHDKLDAEGHYLKGIVLLESGDKQAALASMRNAVYADSAHVAAYIALGQLESEVGQPRRARNAFGAARRLLRREGLHTLPAGAAGFSAGRLDEALQALMSSEETP